MMRPLNAVQAIFVLSLCTSAVPDDLAPYRPRPVSTLAGASYVSPDGSAVIMGSEGTANLLKKFNELFIATHPGMKITMLSKGLPSVPLYGITTGNAAFALIEREIWPLEIRPFRQLHGYEPTGIRIGRAGYVAAGRVNPPGIYVNARNPLHLLTMKQVTRVFTTGNPAGDITHWGQLGLPDEWSQRVIHVYGPRDDGGLASALRQAAMDGFSFSPRYEPLPACDRVLQAVANDLYGIGLSGFCDPAPFLTAVKMLPLAKEDRQPYAGASLQEIADGAYPLAPHLMLYVDSEPGKPLDPLIKEFARLMLSQDGQAIIAGQKDSPGGYLPLTASEASKELIKLNP